MTEVTFALVEMRIPIDAFVKVAFVAVCVGKDAEDSVKAVHVKFVIEALVHVSAAALSVVEESVGIVAEVAFRLVLTSVGIVADVIAQLQPLNLPKLSPKLPTN